MSKNVLVVGGSRGIGRAITEKFASNGDCIYFSYKASHDLAEALESQLQRLGALRVEKHAIDAAQSSAIGFYEEILGKSGGIDILVNCAGITRDRTLKKMAFEEWDDVIKTNLYSAFYSCRVMMPSMLGKGFGRIINISSVVGQTGGFGQSNYAASKSAIIGFTKSIAQECGTHDVTANVVCPGFVDTDMTENIPDVIRRKICERIPKKNFGKTSDVADLVAYLARLESGYITGQQFNVNGGLYM